VAEAADVTLIAQAAREGQWQAAAWRLERKFPSKWGRREEASPEAEAAKTKIAELQVKRLEAEIALLQKRASEVSSAGNGPLVITESDAARIVAEEFGDHGALRSTSDEASGAPTTDEDAGPGSGSN
jgi:hypothetical protein